MQNLQNLMKKTLDENNQEFFLMAGTLLGCIRNHDFISHDGDIDIGIFYDNLTPSKLIIVYNYII